MDNETDILKDIVEEEVSGDEKQNSIKETASGKPRFVALKVIGIVAGILAAVALGTYIIVNTPPVKYRIANFYASQGRYIEARDKLHTILDYKDANRKYDEYALIITKSYYMSGDYDEAWKWAEWTTDSKYEDIKNTAVSLMQDIQEHKNSIDAQHQPEKGLVNSAN